MANPSLSCAATLALALAGGTAWAGSGRVSGQVAGPDGRPIEGVVVASGAAARATTDAGGLYALEGVEAGGRVVVSFAKAGHATTYGTVEIPSGDDADGDGVPDAKDRCPASDQRPNVTLDGCDTGLGNGIRKGCTAMDVLLDCSERACGSWRGHTTACREHECKPWHLLGCLADPKFLRRVDGLTWQTWKRAVSCARKATLPLAELGQQPPAPSSSATLHATLLPGVVEKLDATAGGRVESDGFAVTFPAGSILATGEVEVGLATLDVTVAPGALPGDSRAIDSSLRETLIEPRGALQITLTKDGLPVSVAYPDTLPVQIEVPLAPDSDLWPGDTFSLWSFDAADGLWKQQFPGPATVAGSVGGPFVAVGAVSGPGWWTVAGRTDFTACLCGPVEDASRAPFAGALVTAAGLDRPGITAAQSGGDGAYCVDARLGSRVSLGASAVAGGLRVDSLPLETQMPAFPGDASTGGCGPGPALVLPAASCVCGTTRATADEYGAPRPGVPITTSAGSTATSDAQGRFCLAAPAGRRITLFGEGYEAMDVETGGPATAPEGCVIADLVPPS
jgi:hypothetical protein